MRVGQRLFLAVLPAVLGVLAMAGLAYWGQRGRQVPEWVLVAGVLTAIASLAMAWHNTRYVARRVEELSRRRAEPAAADDPADELDSIELRIADAERWGETREHAAEALVREYAGLLADASATVGRKLDEVRLPLHILLTSPFGELNENQEEMIGAAQQAAGNADEALRFIDRIVDLDAGRVTSRAEAIRPRDLLQPVLAAVEPRLRQAGATLETDLPPTLPRVHVDPRHTREAVSLVLDQLANRAVAGVVVSVKAGAMEGFVRLRIEGGSPVRGEQFPLAQRLLWLQGATIASTAQGVLEVDLPVGTL
jgi:hypothetical protein